MIFAIWQPRAASTHLLAQECGTILGEKTTHTGTLDPMAEGVVVLATGEDRYIKGSLSDWKKTYVFSILWGIQTDSGDQLGLITNVATPELHRIHIESIIAEFPQQYLQEIPAFSARRYAGSSSFELSKQGAVLTRKHRLVNISGLEILKTYEISLENVVQEQARAVSQVHGNFRQAEVQTDWKKLVKVTEQKNRKFFITECRVTTSPGTYIRQLVQDLAQKMDIPATTWSITRIQNGPFTKEDCIEIDELSELQPTVM